MPACAALPTATLRRSKERETADDPYKHWRERCVLWGAGPDAAAAAVPLRSDHGGSAGGRPHRSALNPIACACTTPTARPRVAHAPRVPGWGRPAGRPRLCHTCCGGVGDLGGVGGLAAAGLRGLAAGSCGRGPV